MRFDPYTGEPINDDNEANVTDQPTQPEVTPQSENPTNGSYDASQNQDATPNYNANTPTEPNYQGNYNTGANNYNQAQTGTQQYNANPNQQYNPYNNQYNQQYNPYNGQPAGNVKDPNASAEKLGTAAIICGILSIVFAFTGLCCCPIISIGTGIAGIVCGAKAVNADGIRIGKGKAGLITGIIGLVLTILFGIGAFVFSSFFNNSTVNNPDFWQKFQDEFNNNRSMSQDIDGLQSDSAEFPAGISFDTNFTK